MSTAGRLVVVGTPIGNLGDMSPRAIEALCDADAIVCEDTRRTGMLLQHTGVDKTPMIVANEHTEDAAIDKVLDRVANGETVALVTDAGMPAISDPGERIVAAVAAAEIEITVVPGPTAVSAALATSGLPTARFVFEGFLPRKGSARAERLLELVDERRTVVFYEAPHRAERTLNDLSNMLGPDRRVAVARELTKLHEEVWRGTLGAAVEWAGEGLKGELVFVVEGAARREPPTDDAIQDELRAAISQGESKRDAVASVSDRLGIGKNRAYDLATEL